MPAEKTSGVKWEVVAVVVMVLAVLWPLLTTEYPPMVDYPNHVGRAVRYAHFSEWEESAKYYLACARLIPNSAIDLVLPAFLHVAPPMVASKMFLVFDALLFCGGALVLAYMVFGRVSWRAATMCAFFYNSPLLYGFVNYTVGLALSLWAMAAWLYWMKRPGVASYALAAAAICVAFTAHLSSLAIIGLSVSAITLVRTFQSREWRFTVQGMCVFGPVGVLYLLFRPPPSVGATVWSTVMEKVILMASVVRSYSSGFDKLLIAGLCVAALIAAATYRPTRKMAKLINVEWFAVFVLLAAAALVTPKVAYGSSAADARFVPAVWIALLLAFSLPRVPSIWPGVLFPLLFLGRTIEIATTWHRLDLRNQQGMKVLATIPVASTVITTVDLSGSADENKADASAGHLANFAIASRRLIVANMFAYAGQNPLTWRRVPPYQTSTSAAGILESSQVHQYLLSFKPRVTTKDSISSRFGAPLVEEGGWVLWKTTAAANALAKYEADMPTTSVDGCRPVM